MYQEHIPNEVYEHIRWSYGGDAAGPCASMIKDGIEYILTQAHHFNRCYYVSCTMYKNMHIHGTRGKYISLSLVPESITSDWTIHA